MISSYLCVVLGLRKFSFSKKNGRKAWALWRCTGGARFQLVCCHISASIFLVSYTTKELTFTASPSLLVAYEPAMTVSLGLSLPVREPAMIGQPAVILGL